MLTRCPHCETTFRVSAGTLRIAHGQVRCGRCHRRFDAIAELVDDAEPHEDAAAVSDTGSVMLAPNFFESAEEAGAAEPRSLTDQDLARIFVDERDWQARHDGTASDSARGATAPESRDERDEDDEDDEDDELEDIVVEEQQELEEITLEGRRIEISGTYTALAEPEGESPEDATAPATERHQQAVTIVLGEDEDEELLPPLPPDEILLPADFERDEGFELTFQGQPEELHVLPGDERITAPVPWRPEHPPDDTTVAELSGASPPALLVSSSAPSAGALASARPEPLPAADTETPVDLDDIAPAREERRARPVLYTLLSLALATLLLLQVVHHFRQDLVRHPRFGELIGNAYTRLGMPLSPNWNPALYEVQQWGIASLPGDASTLRLRASVTNLAVFPQPYPLLRLTLEDLWGAEVGTRALEPSEYLPPGTSPDRMMAPGQRTDAEVRIVDPGEDAVGFRIDVCVRSGSALRCAGDAGDSVP
jgi:predicted Zn finger-like uncharacterized protein